MKKLIFIALLATVVASSNLSAMSNEEMVDDANSIINLFTQQYGPLLWKEANLGLDFSAHAQNFIAAAGAASSDKDFYRAVSSFLAGFNDAHISYQIPTTLVSYLPFTTEYFKDAVVITGISEKLLPKEKFPVSIGDKLVAMDGVPIEEVIDTLIPFDNTGNGPTNRKLVGSAYLTFRRQLRFIDVPSGAVRLTILPKGSSAPIEVTTEWLREGFDLAEMPPKSAVWVMAKALSTPITKNNCDAGNILDQLSDSNVIEFPNLKNTTLIGDYNPVFILWDDFEIRMKEPYFTGVFTVNGHKIGFIRVSSWRGYSNDPRLVSFQKEIEYMNSNTDALILDQSSNGGGNSCYMNKIASFFTTQPRDEIKFQVRANRTWLTWLEDSFGNDYDPDNAHAKVWLKSLRDAVTSGQYLSAPIADCSATGKVLPYRNKDGILTLYIKPVLVLVNELDFSAADMFPVLMQDWGVAKLFGTRTAGAGGNVIQAWPIGNSELMISLTQSLMYRSQEVMTERGTPTHYVENVGATPDYEYETTSADYFDRYSNYCSAIENVILELIDGPK